MTTVRRAHVFIVRDDTILVLRQAGGAGWWEQPGGDLEADEDPIAAVVRETFEETSLRIEAPELLREWAYRGRSGTPARSYMYVAHSRDSDVRLSPEHTDFAWMGIDEYEERYCGAHLDAVVPSRADFLAGMRQNIALLREWLRGQ